MVLVAGVASAGTITFIIPGGGTDLVGFDNIVGTDGALGDPLFGFGIDVGAVAADGTPANSGSVASCRDCELTFLTGGLSAFDPGVDPNLWVFDGGGQISIAGHVDLNGNGVVDPGEPNSSDPVFPFPLLQGAFSDDSFAVNLGAGDTVEAITFSTILDFKHPFLTSFYGLPNKLYDGEMFLTFSADRLDIGGEGDPAAFVSRSIGVGFIVNDVPEPGTLSLFGLSLVGLVSLVRLMSARRCRAQHG